MQDLQALISRGQVLQGVVTDKHENHVKGNIDYYVSYQAPGVSGDDLVGSDEYDSYEVGQAVQVTVDPKDPAVRRLGTVDKDRLMDAEQVRFWAILLFLLGCGTYSVASELSIYRERALLARGLALPATVLAVTGKPQNRKVACRFELPDGTAFEITRPIKRLVSCAPGSATTVLCLLSKPKQARLATSISLVATA